MWNKSSIEMTDSMRNVIKNFDPYQVLQPLKADTINKENILVDLSDNNAPNVDTVANELNGSLLEKTTKSEFDVIDIFQNLFVTAEHVTKRKEDSSGLCSQEDRDWIKVFDSLDYRNDVNVDVKKDLTSVFTVLPESKPDTAFLKVFDRKNNELNEEKLAMQRIQNDMMQSPTKVGNSSTNVSDHRAVLTNKSLTIDHNTHIIKRNNIQSMVNTTSSGLLEKAITTNDLLITKSLIKNMYKFNGIYDPANCQNVQMIQTVKLNKKKYAKRQVVSYDEKLNYTKGPDLLEKSIALPAMIERLKARQKSIDDQKYMKRRLILKPENTCPFLQRDPTAVGISNEMPRLKPIVLNADCIRRRLC